MSRYTGRREVYFVPRLTRVEYETLKWLADRGYDGTILKVAGVAEEHDDGGATLGGMTESEAWEINQYIESDPDAFLASNGSRGLSDKLRKFLNGIV